MTSTKNNLYEVEAEIVHKTARSIYIKVGQRHHWVPNSLIESSSEIDENSLEGDSGILVIPQWFAEKKDIDDGSPLSDDF